MNTGVPQGSSNGLPHFTIFINDLMDTSERCNFIYYTEDDTQLCPRRSCMPLENHNLIVITLQRVDTLKFHVSKTMPGLTTTCNFNRL